MSDDAARPRATPPSADAGGGEALSPDEVDPSAPSVGGLPAGDRIDDLDPNDAFRTVDEDAAVAPPADSEQDG